VSKATTAGKPLIVVESPTKARTLSRILGRGYNILSSQGHIRDLPDKELGVDLEHEYAPRFRIIPRKQEVVKKLKDAASSAPVVLLATDPDREGEAIAWHLAEILARPAQRIEFREFTRSAVQAAVDHPHQINRQRVDAQLGRRVLDRLVGYRISPVLWRKVKRGLSAGRVQSVAVRLICEREEEIRAFTTQEYWTLEGLFACNGAECKAQLIELDGQKVLRPSRKDEADGRIIASGEEAERLRRSLMELSYSVGAVTDKRIERSPAPPFITATLQQEAFKKLGFQAKRTMRAAQELYEGVDVGAGPEGLITYMRTDSVRVEAEFARSARSHIQAEFGADYLPTRPREYRRKKGAQDAHEAIRPTNLAYTPERVKSRLSADQFKVYTLVYNRFLASQMASAVLSQRQVDIVSAGGEHAAKFRRTGTQVLFDGFLRLYREEDANGENGGNGPADAALARITAGLPARLVSLEAAQHFTKPPPRYTEASLIKVLEENGIGRPSTYSPIIETIVDRGYITREGRSLAPTEWAFVVTELMKDYFPEVVDVDFTARMEERLDEVEEGRGRWQELVAGFYEPLAKQIDRALADKKKYRPEPVVLDERCPECGQPLVVRDGRFGKFTACSGYPECRYVKREEKAAGNNVEPVEGKCPKCGAALVARRNRWGSQFVACTAFPKCDFTREPQDTCPKCGGKLLRLQAKNRRVFYACEHNQRAGEGEGAGSCDFVLWGRPTVQKCGLCGWFMAEKKQRGTTVTFCSNPACPNHRGHEQENDSE